MRSSPSKELRNNHSKVVEIEQSRNDSYARWRNEVYECLIDAGMNEEAGRWVACNTYHRVEWNVEKLPDQLPQGAKYALVCDQHGAKHPIILQKHTCGLRFCPTCAEQHSARLVNRYAPVAEKMAQSSSNFNIKHIVLTTPYGLTDENIKEKYKQHRKNIVRLLDELLPSGWRKCQGAIVGDEFGENGNKLHSHILAFSQFIKQQKIASAWKRITNGECQVVWIEKVKTDKKSREAKIAEVLKYCTKFWREADDGTRKMIDPQLIPALAKVLKGQRRIRTYGVFYNIEEIEEEDKQCECRVCGSSMKKVWLTDWQLFVETGMTWRELEESLNLEVLNSIPANKSLYNKRKRHKPPPDNGKKQLIMAGFEANHYTND